MSTAFKASKQDQWPEMGPIRSAGRADELRLLRDIRHEVLPDLTALEREGRMIRAQVKDSVRTIDLERSADGQRGGMATKKLRDRRAKEIGK